MAIRPFTRDAAGYLYFAAGPSDSVRKCNAQGYEIATWKAPRGIAAMTIGPDGNLYVAMGPADNPFSGQAPAQIAKYTTTGTLLGRWATEHLLPSSVAVAASGDI